MPPGDYPKVAVHWVPIFSYSGNKSLPILRISVKVAILRQHSSNIQARIGQVHGWRSRPNSGLLRYRYLLGRVVDQPYVILFISYGKYSMNSFLVPILGAHRL